MTKKWGILIKKESESLEFAGLKIPRDYLLCMEVENVALFLKRIESDECSTKDLRIIFSHNQEEDGYKPSLYVDFDKRLLYSMYIEPSSYEDYVPVGWDAKYQNFIDLIPVEKCYWKK